MAIYHLSVKIVTRGKGKSAVAAGSYRSGDALKNENEGTSFDYSRKGGIVYTEILLPTNAPREFTDRSALWNAVEKIEKASNAQLAREIEFSLPIEFTKEQNIELARRFIQDTFVSAGMIADVCYHDKNDGNPHVHVLLTMRPFNEDGSWGTKQKKEYILDEDGNKIYDPVKRQYQCRSIPTTDWNDWERAEDWRAAWEEYLNADLARYGFSARVDHRSYERQGIEKIPTIHLGISATQMERRGIATDRGNINREIAVTNNQIRQLRARVNKVKLWLDENKANTPPTLAEVLNEILNTGADKTHSKRIADLKLAAKTLMFIQQNNICDLPALADKVNAIHRDCEDALDRKKKAERRVKTLDKHLLHSRNFTKHCKLVEKRDALYAEYHRLDAQGLFSKGKAKEALDKAEAFDWKHLNDLQEYDAAEKYLREVLQKRYDPKKIPAQKKKWEGERETCARELAGIDTEYTVLKSDVQDAETIKRFAVKLMVPDEPQERQKQKTHNREEL